MDGLVTVEADAPPLVDGKHRIGIGFIVTGMGEMRFEVTDVSGAVVD